MNYNLLIRYLAGESSDIEKDRVKQWLEADPKNRRLLEELELIWMASGKGLETVEDDFDAAKDWKMLQHSIEEDKNREQAENKKLKLKKSGTSYRYFEKRSGIAQFARIAAVLLIAALAGIYAWQNLHTADSEEEEVTMREIVMDKGQRANMVLSDGTNMNINAGSKVRMPEIFQSDKREVFLEEGEAYFEVTSDQERPFLIHSGGAVIRVLGTSFVVRAYPEDETVRVVVNEGEVMLAPGQEENMDMGIALTAGQLGRYHIRNDRVTSEEVDDMELFLSWVDGYLKFEDTSMKEVALQLERRYNVQVEFSDPALEDLRLTAVLRGRSITNVLNVITASLELGYQETGRQKIIFTGTPEK